MLDTREVPQKSLSITGSFISLALPSQDSAWLFSEPSGRNHTMNNTQQNFHQTKIEEGRDIFVLKIMKLISPDD